jgi:hypothetical protein
MSQQIIIHTLQELTECVLEEHYDGNSEQFTEEDCSNIINSLTERNYLKRGLLEDEYVYMLNQDISQSVCEDKLSGSDLTLMLQFFNNPKATFIIYNTQKGKTNILSKHIKQIKQNSQLKPVFYIIVSNDQTLAAQSSESILSSIQENDCEVFTLSSLSKTTFGDLKTKMDAYIADDDNEYKTPVIVALANNQQLNKIVALMAHIQYKNSRNPLIKNVPIFDEADETYPRIRDIVVRSKERNVSFLDMIHKDNTSLQSIYWISATEGELLDGKYPECESAANYVCDNAELECPTYRAMHHLETKFKIVSQTSKESKNGYALRNIEENDAHFKTPIILPSGEVYYRKAIINACSKRSSQIDLAVDLGKKGVHVMVFNQSGLTVLKYGDPVRKIYRIKGMRFNKLLFDKYKELNLNDRPLVIMGNKKVNRGISFHYAPQDGSEGLIWTDLILGNIEDKDQAAQKGGRLAGKIAHCPQYPPNELYYWTTRNTLSLICTHNNRIDEINKNSSASTIKEAFESASNKIKEVKVMHAVNASQFRVYKDLEDVKKVVNEICKKEYYFQARDPLTGFIKTSLNGPSEVANLFKAIGKVNTGYTGQRETSSGGRTAYPCYLDTNDPDTLLYVVLIDNLLATEDQKREIEEYGQNIEIPQVDTTGNLIESLKQSIFNM